MSLPQSFIEGGGDRQIDWTTSDEYSQKDLNIRLSQFQEVTDLLLERPNLNSSHLFRADILYDSCERLQTIAAREKHLSHIDTRAQSTVSGIVDNVSLTAVSSYSFKGFLLQRTVVRRLIPRKPQLDRPLLQYCYIYSGQTEGDSASSQSQLVLYVPDVSGEDQMPWYHPPVKAIAYLYHQREIGSEISVHYQPLVNDCEAVPSRLHRTCIALLKTFIRLTKIESPSITSTATRDTSISSRSTAPAALKDTVLPQHIVQDTYTRLKQKYATDLMHRWVEKTEPSKHVFEDIGIAAFLIELWRQMYQDRPFPGFVDLACGNGVLTYILVREGYRGYGYDARRRKTWDILDTDSKLDERLCIPQPFLKTAGADIDLQNINVHDGIFEPETFIISNHADELTPWTPILAALSSPMCPLPFLAIPCCSHALSGNRHRYSLKEVDHYDISQESSVHREDGTSDGEQSSKGDLRALRKQKQQAANHKGDASQYACLTKKVVALAEELGIETEMTLIRIPSTRNIGIIGNRHASIANSILKPYEQDNTADTTDEMLDRIQHLLQRECGRDGGIEAAAKIWTGRAMKLQSIGKGKKTHGDNIHRDTSETTVMDTVDVH